VGRLSRFRRHNTGGRYNPGTNSWIATSTSTLPLRDMNTKRLDWRRNDRLGWFLVNSAYVNTGGRYCALSGPTPTPTPTDTASPTPTATPLHLQRLHLRRRQRDGLRGSIRDQSDRGSIVPAPSDIGNHGDDEVTTVALPFPYTLYDQSFTSVTCRPTAMRSFTNTDTIPAIVACL